MSNQNLLLVEEGKAVIERYTPSDMAEIWTDQAKFRAWLDVELAVIWAKERLGLAPAGTHTAVSQKATFTVDAVNARDREIEHDAQAFVDVVRASLGDLASLFHDGMTSYDMVDPSLALLIKRCEQPLSDRIARLINALRELARRHSTTLKVGRTHGVHGEPITFGFEVLNWLDQVRWTGDLLREAVLRVEIGKFSGAMGTYTLDPEVERLTCEHLGLNQPFVATQIIPRFLHATLFSAIGNMGSVLDKIAQDIRILQRTEIRELEEPRKLKQKGSSAMPHKKNPVLCERISGLARVLRNNAGVGLENVVTWEGRDIAQSSAERIALVDSITGLAYQLDLMITVIEGLKVDPEQMMENLGLTRGLIYSQDVKTLLMKRIREKGCKINPDTVYIYVQKCAFRAFEESRPLIDVLFETPLAEAQLINLVSPEEVASVMNPWLKLQYLPQVFSRFGIQMEIPQPEATT